MQITNTYANSYMYQTQKNNRELENKEVTKKSETDSTGTSDYLDKLKQNNPKIDISAGYSNKNQRTGTGKTDVRIAPDILKKMSSDPVEAQKYEKMLADIPALDKWADSMIHAMTGSEVKYRQVWIDEDGNMGSLCVTGPSEEQKKAEAEKKAQQKEDQEEMIKRRREKKEEFEDWIKGNRDKESPEDYKLEDIMGRMSFDKRI